MSANVWQAWQENAQSIGMALLHSLWQITAVALVLALVLRLLRQAEPGSRYAVALIGLVVMLLWPALSWHPTGSRSLAVGVSEIPAKESVARSEMPLGPSSMLPVHAPKTPPEIKLPVQVKQDFNWSRWQSLIRPWVPWTAWIWGVGVLGLCLWRSFGWWQLQRWTQRAHAPLDCAWQDRVNALAARLGISRSVRLLASTKVTVPMAAGVFRPLILFPLQLLTNLPVAQVEALLAHELTHLRRHDYAINLAQTLVETLLFYHPAVWWINRVIRQERELCCDDLVVAHSSSRQDYILALAKTAEWQCGGTQYLAPASCGGNVLARLQRLLNQRSPEKHSRGFGVALLLMIGALTLAPLVRGALDKPVRGRLLDRNGVVLAETQADGVRHYPWGSLAAHVLGTSSRKKPDIGGVEKTQNETLAKGQDVKLELDVRMQLIVEQVLREAKIGRGAVVLLDPRDGAVRAMASVPNYDPNAFSGSVEKGLMSISQDEYRKVIADQTSPLLNRAISTYTPGSVFKLVGAVAAVKSGMENNHYRCEGSFGIDKRNFSCWVRAKGMNGHGDLDLQGAIKTSCNCYFYQLGIDLGSDKIYDTAKLLGFDGATGIELPEESTGLVVSDSHRHSMNIQEWTNGHTANIVIGQGEVTASPLQIASMSAAIANGGTVWLPHMVKGAPMERAESHGVLTKEILDPVRKGMWELVHGAVGTGKSAKSEIIEIAGKTGTAQQWRQISGKSQPVQDNIAWFTAFAPYAAPRFAITVMVQNGTAGGSTCAPIVKRILEQVGKLEEAGRPEATTAQPVIEGHFEHIESVTFGE